MNALHSIKIIYPSLCENRIAFRLTFLLPEILFLSLFKPQQVLLVLLLLLQMCFILLVGITIPSKPYPLLREKTEKVD
jgi:hypothetical protein